MNKQYMLNTTKAILANLLILSVYGWTFPHNTTASSIVHVEQKSPKPILTECIDKNLGDTIKCSPSWDVLVHENSIEMVIDDQDGRLISASISKSEKSITRLSELYPSTLQRVYNYVDSFRFAKVRLGSKPAIRVLGYDGHHPDKKMLDYFLVRNKHLYRLNFSVNAEEYFEEYEPLFNQIAASFKFFNPPQTDLTYKKKDLFNGRAF